MKALVFTGPGVVELQDAPEPEVGAGEVLVHVTASGICGSELHGVKRPGFRTPPLIMGHEFTGHTDDGQPVVINPILSCGACDLCAQGQPNICRNRQILGIHRPGGYAERVAVPAASVIPLPGGIDPTAAAVIEPLANAVHAWRLAGHPAGARVAIIGAGTIGLTCLQTACTGKAASIHVADRSPERLAAAARLGATTTGTELTGEYDVIFDAVGAPATREQSVAHLRPGGVTVWLGLADPTAAFDAADLVRTEKRVVGSFAYTGTDFAAAIDLVSGWDLTWVDTYPLDEGADIFTQLMHGQALPIKALLTPLKLSPESR
ncbi:MAG TPA: alcohol dehydrogenase catalytic domain-containing protein [Nonomuraea sp.]|nr:alcohol dehydrogenase catalytic domain-containing protein [Nonomuraea sp.]